MLRTHTCGELRKGDSNKEVTLAGWVHAIRLHGNVTFIDLRDRYGITQCVLSEELKKDGSILKKEYVIQIKGQVYAKPEPNKKLTTGDVEVRVKSFEILNEAEPLPLDLEASNLTEETRLKWRFLDLRREKMQNNLITRFKVLSSVREFYKDHGFILILQ